MKNEILSTFPEINEIQDSTLREKTIATWVKAMELSDLSFDDLRGMPFTLLVSEVNITFVEHVRTVCRMCIACWDVLNDAYGDRNAATSWWRGPCWPMLAKSLKLRSERASS